MSGKEIDTRPQTINTVRTLPTDATQESAQTNESCQMFYKTFDKTRQFDSRHHQQQCKARLQRQLGGLETMYHNIISKGMDMICLMTKLATTFPITSDMSIKALYLLAQRHPLLRMTIQCKDGVTSGDISFLEMDDVQLDFQQSEREDWLSYLLEEVAQPFDIKNGPLWKCRLLGQKDSYEQPNSQGNDSADCTDKMYKSKGADLCTANEHRFSMSEEKYPYETTFLFIWHHSIMDGGYVVWVFKEFAELLDKIYSSGSNSIPQIRTSVELPLLQPMEDIVDTQFTQEQNTYCAAVQPSSSSSISLVASDSPYDVLKDYNEKFIDDIRITDGQILNNQCLVFEFSRHETSIIERLCKEHDTSINGLFIAASILAFINLVYPVSNRRSFDIPFEFMMDLRRHYQLDFPKDKMKYYTGVAAIDVPMLANIKLNERPVTKREFWEMARSFGSSINDQIKSPQTFQRIHKTIRNRLVLQKDAARRTGKSPNVLCLSNMGRLDWVFTGDVAKRMKLIGLHGHPTVLVEDCPIFLVGIHSLNGQLCGNISYCKNYTSVKTAAQYLGHLQNHIASATKL